MSTPSSAVGTTRAGRVRDLVVVVLIAGFAYGSTRYGAHFTPTGAGVFAAGCALVPYGLERLGTPHTREVGVLASVAGIVLISFAILAERTNVIPDVLGRTPDPTTVITPSPPPGAGPAGGPTPTTTAGGAAASGSSARTANATGARRTAAYTGPSSPSAGAVTQASARPGSIPPASVPSGNGQVTPPVTTPPTSPPTSDAAAVMVSQRVAAYDNYGPAIQPGQAMCSGNPARPESVPGGSLTQTFVVPNGVSALDAATIQIDPNPAVTAHASLTVSGGGQVSATAAAAGDTGFAFPRLAVSPGQTVTLSLSFTATQGKLITVYVAGAPGGQFRALNSCSDGAPSTTRSPEGLRAVISGWS